MTIITFKKGTREKFELLLLIQMFWQEKVDELKQSEFFKKSVSFHFFLSILRMNEKLPDYENSLKILDALEEKKVDFYF